MSNSQLLITGATGNVGALVTEQLLARGIRPRVFVRDPDKARATFGDRVDVAVGDLDDARTLAPALRGVEALFLVHSGEHLAELDRAAATVAKAAGVARIVKLSSLDAREQVGTGAWHARGEAAIREVGVAHTFVQPSGVMSNALYWASAIKSDGAVRSATGDGAIAFIHPHDIAAVCAAVLATRTYGNTALPITGPAALSYAEMAAILGEVIGRELRFEPIGEDVARAQQIAWRTAPAMVDARLSIFRAIREGRLATVTDTVERVLGRAPLSFRTWAEQNADAFR